MDKPTPTQDNPYAVDVSQGEEYYWCGCAKSAKQPFCDGSHKGTGFEPIAFTADKTEKVYLCGCMKSKNKPFCDGSHSSP
ncbi:MAG: CDGSH iron-sulfur domain-containing protein [Rhodospirillales bacterium]